MEIRFISSLTEEDENHFAPALLKAVGALLDQLPIAYTVRIQTTGARVFQHTRTHDALADPEARSVDQAQSVSLAGALHSFLASDRADS